MVFFNWATMQMAAKIVYYGPGLCGKTTNLSFIYGKTSPGSRGEMVSLETETDRTLFFDLLPLEVGKVGGFRTRLQLYTVPGQVFYNTTRKLVLKGVDGVVFVADSQRPMADANIESLKNLEENLQELGLDIASVPLVLQYNKRDLKNIAPVEELNALLNPDGAREYFEAVAVRGDGVFETLKAVTKQTLKALRRRMANQDAAPAAVERPVVAPARSFNPAALSAAAEQALVSSAAATPDEEPPADHDDVAEEMAPAAEDVAEPVLEAAVEAPVEPLPQAEELPEAVEAAPPVEEPAPEELPSAEEEAPVEFATTEDEAPPTETTPEVRHVKVSSSLDILTELETLRKAATSHPVSTKSFDGPATLDVDALLQNSLNSRQEVRRRIEESVGPALSEADRCVVRIELLDRDGSSVTTIEPIHVEVKREERLKQLTLNLTVNLHGE